MKVMFSSWIFYRSQIKCCVHAAIQMVNCQCIISSAAFYTDFFLYDEIPMKLQPHGKYSAQNSHNFIWTKILIVSVILVSLVPRLCALYQLSDPRTCHCMLLRHKHHEWHKFELCKNVFSGQTGVLNPQVVAICMSLSLFLPSTFMNLKHDFTQLHRRYL